MRPKLGAPLKWGSGRRLDPDLAEKRRFINFSVISGFCDVQWRATCISNILTFQGGAIRAIRTFCRRAGCRNPNLLRVDLGPTLGRLWADSGPTLGQLWADFELTLGRLWVDLGQTLGRLCADSGPTLGRPWASLGQPWTKTFTWRL